MKAGKGTWLNLFAALAAAVLLPGAVGVSPIPRRHPPDRGTATPRFHAGMPTAAGVVEPACAGKGCHAPQSHRKGGAAAFLNMHETGVSCLACHGRDAEKHWVASPPGPDRPLRLAYLPESRAGGPHEGLGDPGPCERCHSEGGRDRLAAAGWKEIPQGFASPIPMRMMKEGGRRWVPDDVR